MDTRPQVKQRQTLTLATAPAAPEGGSTKQDDYYAMFMAAALGGLIARGSTMSMDATVATASVYAEAALERFNNERT